MIKYISSLILISSLHAKADYVGFASGAEFKATPVEGRVEMTCQDFSGKGQATYDCRDLVLDPSSYDYFYGPKGTGANAVELRVERADGSLKIKTNQYDSKNGKSTSSFNLWISTLFQKPLLMGGVNKVHYSLYDSSVDNVQEFAAGDFTVTVTRGTVRRCPTTEYHSADLNDCSSQYSVCQRYFEQYNQCR